MSSGRSARSSGSAAAASARTTDGSPSSDPVGMPSGTPAPGFDGRRERRAPSLRGRAGRDPRVPCGARRLVLSAAPRGRGRRPDRVVLDALWELVWAGEVTNDTFAPLRALRWTRPGRAARPPRSADQPRPARGRRTWSLVQPASIAAGPLTSPTEQLHAIALALLDRHGVLTREAVMSEGIGGGFAGVYPILRALEETGRIRRGYFVAGLGAAQFAQAGALDRLRAVRDTRDDLGPRGAVLLLPPRTRPTPTAPPSPGRAAPRTAGRSSAPRAPTSAWSRARPCSTSSVAVDHSSRSRPRTSRPPPGRPRGAGGRRDRPANAGARHRSRGRGPSPTGLAARELEAGGFLPAYRGWC